MKKQFPIISVCREDILSCFDGHENFEEIKKSIQKLSDEDMKEIVNIMAQGILENHFWIALPEAFDMIRT